MSSDIPKRIRRLLAEYAGRAEEAELRQALQPLAEAFKQWEIGDLDSFELEQRIHKFHQGPARDIYSRYARPADREPQVAYAIAGGLIDRATVPAELLEHLSRWLAFIDEIENREESGPETT
jgi:hypothetical protein